MAAISATRYELYFVAFRWRCLKDFICSDMLPEFSWIFMISANFVLKIKIYWTKKVHIGNSVV